MHNFYADQATHRDKVSDMINEAIDLATRLSVLSGQLVYEVPPKMSDSASQAESNLDEVQDFAKSILINLAYVRKEYK